LSALGPQLTQKILENKYQAEGIHLTEEKKYKLLVNLLADTFTAGGYWVEGKLWGVGYTDQSAANAEKVLSGEWTLGAIMAVRALIQYYENLQAPDINWRTEVLQTLDTWNKSMTKHVKYLLTSEYANERTKFCYKDGNCTLSGIPGAGEFVELPDDQLGMLYASRRYTIPFGWFANPLPSMASTTWMLMVEKSYNPFAPQGKLVANVFAGKQLDVEPELSNITTMVKNTVDKPVAINYQLENDPTWYPVYFNVDSKVLAGAPDPYSAYLSSALIPAEAVKVEAVYNAGDNDWYRACSLDKETWQGYSEKLLNQPLTYYLGIKWTPNQGSGPCELLGGQQN
jgi:hypothetical protein